MCGMFPKFLIEIVGFSFKYEIFQAYVTSDQLKFLYFNHKNILHRLFSSYDYNGIT